MNKEQATRLVDKWAKDWRTYLDGQLHRGPRHALIEAIVAATSSSDDDASEDLEGKPMIEGKPMTDAGIKAVMREVHQEDQARRRDAQAVNYAPRHALIDAIGPATASALTPGAVLHTAGAATTTVIVGEPDQLAAADALKLLRDAAHEDRRPLMLTPSQVARFNGFGMLHGVDYVVAEPSALDDTKPVEVPRKGPGRPRR